MFRKIWIDPVWSKVIATGIVAILAFVITYFGGWWPTIVDLFTSVPSLLASKTAIPNWLLAFLITCAVLVLAVVMMALWANMFPPRVSTSLTAYTEDELFNIRRRWHYDRDIGIYQLASFCPRCDYQVEPRTPGLGIVDHVSFHCDDCGTLLAEFDMSWDEFQGRVIKKIQKKIRTGNHRT